MSSLKGHMARYGVSGGSWNPESEPSRSISKKYASGGAVKDRPQIGETGGDDGKGGWKKGNAEDRPNGKKFASGGPVRGKQNEDDGKGDWVDHDGSERPDGEPYKNGGRAEAKHKNREDVKAVYSSDEFAGGGKIKAGFIKHPGALRKALHVKDGEKIPEIKLEKAENSKNPTTRKRAVLAETMKKWHR